MNIKCKMEKTGRGKVLFRAVFCCGRECMIRASLFNFFAKKKDLTAGREVGL